MSCVSVRRSAERELSAAAAWYDRQQAGLGREFLEGLGRAFARIEESPLSNPLWQEGAPYRKFVLPRFPYVVFYVESGLQVSIVAVAHARRKPVYWARRRP